MTRKKKQQKKLLKITAELTNQLIGQIDSSKLIEIKTIQFVLACEILNDKEKERIFQGYLTKEEKQEYIEKGEKIGIKKGEKGKEEEIVKNLIKLGQTPEFIAKATNIDKNVYLLHDCMSTCFICKESIHHRNL